MDYIAGMGFDAIWISPVTHSLEGNTTWGYGYHGYWLDDPYRLNEHFGSAQDLHDLSDEVHRRGMALMVDVVVNHFAINTDPPTYGHLPAPFNSVDAFHPRTAIDHEDQSSIENGWLVHDQLPLLADVNTENPVVFDALVQSVVQLVRNFRIDGIRLDTARHMPWKALVQFQEAVGVFVTGEILNGDVEYVSRYQGALDSVLNYPLYFEAAKVFSGDANFHSLADIITSERTTFPDPTVLVNFLDNHDQPRLASSSGGINSDMNAATFSMLMPGIPSIYYGFEQRLQGGKDPENREALWEAGYDRSAPMYKFIARLNEIRRLGGPWLNSSFVDVLKVADSHLAFQRGPLVVLVSNSTEADTGRMLATSFTNGIELVEMLKCEDVAVTGISSTLSIPPNSNTPQVWAPVELAARLCGSHDKRNGTSSWLRSRI